MGSQVVSLRGAGPWRGRTTRGPVDRGERRMIRVQNGLISTDGHEIRQWPGWKCVVDLTPENNALGYQRPTLDFMWPITMRQNGYTLYVNRNPSDPLTLHCKANIEHLHGFESIRNKIIVWGESGARHVPIKSSPERNSVSITNVDDNGSGLWRLTLSPGTNSSRAGTATDAAGPGLQYLRLSDTVWIENVTCANPTVQAAIDAKLNNRFHRISNASGALAVVDLETAIGTSISSTAATGDIYRTRGNRTDTFGTPGITPYETDVYDRIDDPRALTIFTLVDKPDQDAPTLTCYPAWVANRMRDYGDGSPSNAMGEGDRFTSSRDGISRRRQMPLPYRTNPDIAGNRLLLAAPGYACIFQCPVLLPTKGDSFPVTPGDWTNESGVGEAWPFNDNYDKPRCLGLPKAVLTESLYKTPPNTPQNNYPFDFAIYRTVSGAAGDTFPAGTYRFAISYVDDYTDEEGEASEIMEVTVPTPAVDSGFGIALLYMHPGYYFPETLVTSINIYMAPPGTDALGLYKSVMLTDSVASSLPAKLSAKYGHPSDTSANVLLTRRFLLPLPVGATTAAELEAACDQSRPPPIGQRQMPRGGECVRTIRAVTMTLGHRGTHGLAKELQHGRASALWDQNNNAWKSPDEIQIRAFITPTFVSSDAGAGNAGTQDGPWGIASGYMPDSYEGLTIYSRDLFPAPRTLRAMDRIDNMKTSNANAGAIDYPNGRAQRILMQQPVFDKDIGVVGSPYPLLHTAYDAYLVLPRGQVTVGEPGKPDIASDIAIQFLDATKDDDGVAAGNLNGQGILCSRKETFLLQWARHPLNEVPQLISREFGCIATNSTVEFDLGLAWISERGPVACPGGAPEHVGAEIEEDFSGQNRRYDRDANGMMRHCFGAHDPDRGVIYWGLVTTSSTHQITFESVTGTYRDFAGNDRAQSRFPCDEILAWNYRQGAFTTWRPPSGLEVLWMRRLQCADGVVRMCFLAADQRIYALDDAWADSNESPLTATMTANGSGTSIVLPVSFGVDGDGGAAARGSANNLVREGMTVVQFDENGAFIAQTTVAAGSDPGTSTLVVADLMSWSIGDTFAIGVVPALEIQTAYCGDMPDNLSADAVIVRYWLGPIGSGNRPSFARVQALKSDLDYLSPSPVDFSNEYESLGNPTTGSAPFVQRRRFPGKVEAPEVSLQATFIGLSQVRLTDLQLEVA